MDISQSNYETCENPSHRGWTLEDTLGIQEKSSSDTYAVCPISLRR